MSFFKRIFDFFKHFKKEKTDNSQSLEKISELEKNANELEEKLEIYSQSIITKLYSLEQIVNILRIDYPEKYEMFIKRIEELRTDYLENLAESEKSLTFEINPDRDFQKMSEVIGLEKKIKDFIDIDMKYDIISKKVQKFILKLNILYNTSIFYPNEKNKVLKQLSQGFISQRKLTASFKEWGKVLERELEKEKMYILFSYSEYLMFKIYIRNSENFHPKDYSFVINRNLSSDSLFKNFKDYMLDEISDIEELVERINDEFFSNSYRNRINEINKIIVSNRNEKDIIFNEQVWKEKLQLENEILNKLIEENYKNKDEIKIKVLDKLNISVKEKEIYTVPKIETILNLSSIYYGKIKNDALIIMRFLQGLSDDISYKDIYFLIVLFDMLPDVRKKCPELYKKIEKYDLRYKYTNEEMNVKKEQVLKSTKKEYIFTFKINDYEENSVRKYLEEYTIDYHIEDNKVYMNKIYFSDLENIKKDLEKNSKN